MRHVIPKNTEREHVVAWPKDGKSDCPCGAKVEGKTVVHRPIKNK